MATNAKYAAEYQSMLYAQMQEVRILARRITDPQTLLILGMEFEKLRRTLAESLKQTEGLRDTWG